MIFLYPSFDTVFSKLKIHPVGFAVHPCSNHLDFGPVSVGRSVMLSFFFTPHRDIRWAMSGWRTQMAGPARKVFNGALRLALQFNSVCSESQLRTDASGYLWSRQLVGNNPASRSCGGVARRDCSTGSLVAPCPCFNCMHCRQRLAGWALLCSVP